MTPNNSRHDQTAGGGPSQIPLAEGHGAEWAGQINADELAKVMAEDDRNFHAQQEAKTMVDNFRAAHGDDFITAQQGLNEMTLRDDMRPVKIRVAFIAMVVVGIFAFGYALAAPAPERVDTPTPCMTKGC